MSQDDILDSSPSNPIPAQDDPLDGESELDLIFEQMVSDQSDVDGANLHSILQSSLVPERDNPLGKTYISSKQVFHILGLISFIEADPWLRQGDGPETAGEWADIGELYTLAIFYLAELNPQVGGLARRQIVELLKTSSPGQSGPNISFEMSAKESDDDY